MNAVLFDDFERTDMRPAGNAEPSFSFMNRSAWSSMSRARRELMKWLNRLPVEERLRIARSLRSHRDADHVAAFLELWTHEVLSGCFSQVTVHPELPATSKTPDFRFSGGGGAGYVECKVVLGSADDRRREAFRDKLADAINREVNAPFWFWLEWITEPDVSPNMRAFLDSLKSWTTSLDYDAAIAGGVSFDRPITRVWEYDDWKVKIGAFPKNDRSASLGETCVVSEFPAVEWIDDVSPIRRAVLNKARSYGEIGAPYVLVLASDLHVPDRVHLLDALFGRDSISASPGRKPHISRTRDGAWFDHGGARYTRLSAVLYLPVRPHSWTVMGREIPWTLVHNPFAAHPAPRGLFPFASELVPEGRYLKEVAPEMSVAEYMGLPPDWPGKPG